MTISPTATAKHRPVRKATRAGLLVNPATVSRFVRKSKDFRFARGADVFLAGALQSMLAGVIEPSVEAAGEAKRVADKHISVALDTHPEVNDQLVQGLVLNGLPRARKPRLGWSDKKASITTTETSVPLVHPEAEQIP